VLFDNRAGVKLALEHLHKLGHRRVAVLTSTQASTPDRPTDTSVLAEADRLGLDVTVHASPHALGAATHAAREVLCKDDRPTALFCLSDSIAYGAYAAARGLGLRIPSDLSINGYDNHPVSGLLSPPLTTFDWDREGISRTAAQLVAAAIEGRPRRRRVVKVPVLHRRESTGAAPGARPRPRQKTGAESDG
jgi:LacI family transcriptional regulator